MAVPNVSAIPSKVHLFSNILKYSTVHRTSCCCCCCHNGNTSEHRKLKNIGAVFCNSTLASKRLMAISLGRREGTQRSSFHHAFGLQQKSRLLGSNTTMLL
eukprot:TRINITY_DN8874_c0_g1_i1.p1 TRINITY_DN8874_c0_g1~~TRINITY_DN8874_c0_g1_i1.p1  ORF type:complete len:101 (+),score=10.39 TRINITY_DN8874_c0_g1_i1:179-481(+)